MSSKITLSMSVVGGVVGGIVGAAVYDAWRGRASKSQSSTNDVSPGSNSANSKGASPRHLAIKPDVQRAPRESATDMTEVVSPADLTETGAIYGGQVMAWMDICAGVTASKHCGRHCVTANMKELHFLSPIKGSDIVKMTGKVVRAFRTSMEVRVVVRARTLSGKTRYCCTALFVFVALDADKKPAEVPKIFPETRLEQKDYEESLKRREEGSSFQKKVKDFDIEDWKQFTSDHELPKEGDNTRDPRDTRITMSEVVLPLHANTMGITFGGQVMKWMELACYICASQHACHPTLTASVDDMKFGQPSTVGDMLVFRAQINRVFRSSMCVGVTVEKVRAGEMIHISSAYFTVVAADVKGNLYTDVPKVLPQTFDDMKRYYIATMNRRRRLENRDKLKEQSFEEIGFTADQGKL